MDVQEFGDEVVVTLASRSLFGEDRLAETRKKLLSLVEGWAERTVRVDMREVEFINGDALGLLIILHKKIRRAGGTVVLCDPNADILEIFHITKLDKLFQIVFDGADPCVIVDAGARARS